MKSTLLKLSFIFLLLNMTVACKKNKTGGKATLKGVVKHHDKPIAGAYIYVKFNSSEFPGEDYKLYDTYVKAEENGNYTIPFYKGTYYVYAVGLDMDIPYPYKVSGGTSFSIRNNENLTKDLAITEE